MSILYPQHIPLAQLPTPLHPLDNISSELKGPRIWIKRDDLTGAATSGNKIRKLEFVLAQAGEEGCDRIITCGGIQSNHCRTTAILCAQLGLKCHLILRGENEGIAEGNLFIDQLVGADISYHSVADYQRNLPDLFQQYQALYEQQGQKSCLVPVGASDETGIWGYVKATEELKADFANLDIEPNYIVTATGSGGTQAGLTAGVVIHNLSSQVWGMAVCDDAHYFESKVRQDIERWKSRYCIDIALDDLDINVDANYIGPGYAKATAEVFATIRHIASAEGIILDPVYTGKAFHGMIEEIKHGRFEEADNIVFIHTGGIFGLFPYRAATLST